MTSDETTQIKTRDELPERLGGSCIVLIYGGNLGERHPVTGELTIGRSEANTVVVQRPEVSRRHFRVFSKGASCFAEDLRSTNGTYVNDEPIEGPTALKSGDRLRAGQVIFKFLDGSDVETLYHEEVYRLTVTDGLTRLPNRRFLDEFLRREVARSQRHQHPLAVGMFDIDNFKRVNDTWGHPMGDRVLIELGRLMSRSTRRENLFARSGGDEFVLVMIEAGLEDASSCCERMRGLVEAMEVGGEEPGSEPARVTISVGVSSMVPPVDAARLIHEADRALYAAKQEGGNLVVAAESAEPDAD